MSSTSGSFLLDQSPIALEPELGIYLFAAELEARPLRHKKRISQMVNH